MNHSSVALSGSIVFLSFCILVAAFILISIKVYMTHPSLVGKISKYLLVGFIWLIFSVASVLIGFRIGDRHQTTYSRSKQSVAQIWGGQIVQTPPQFFYKQQELVLVEEEKKGLQQKKIQVTYPQLGIESHKLRIEIKSNIRTKGLLKFPGYDMKFHAEYILKNTLNRAQLLQFRLNLPTGGGNISDLSATANQKPLSDTNFADGIDWEKTMQPGEEAKLEISYTAKGTESISYSFGTEKKQVKHFEAVLRTDFTNTSLPENSMVPVSNESDKENTVIKWEGNNLILGQNLSVKFNISGNYGELASKLFYYAPFSMFLFIASMLIFSVSKEIKFHPMNFLFLVAGFFIFYLLSSYLISYMHVLLGIFLSLVVSTGIMVYYSILLNKGQTIVYSTLVISLIFQWIFSLAFFLPEHTGLLITLASIMSFFILMKTTSSTEWEHKC